MCDEALLRLARMSGTLGPEVHGCDSDMLFRCMRLETEGKLERVEDLWLAWRIPGDPGDDQ